MRKIDKGIKKDFPIFKNNSGLVFLDSGASTQKPKVVIDAVKEVYEKYYANVHRGIYKLSEESSELYEQTREKVAKFINTSSEREIVFTKNTTESINLLAFTWGYQHIKKGDVILVTEMEHHANLLPWRELAKQKKAIIKYVPVKSNGRLDMVKLDKMLTSKVKLLAITHMSNVLGTINPIKKIVTKAHKKGIKVMVDGAQAAPHFPVDVTDLDADFYAFSPHKMLAPSGVGILYAKEEILESMNPFLTGGSMIAHVTHKEAEWNEIPFKFEAGTPNIEGVIGFGSAIDYLNSIGMKNIFKHEQKITKIALRELSKVEGLKIMGPKESKDRGAVFAFTLDDIHPHDMATMLDELNIAIRAGHHCAQPLHQSLGIEATTRASFYLYNTEEDIKKLVRALIKVKKLFK
ncbi:MAG: aminotransferase class V-fold PLP-dependent enzyme [Candidatus Kerfeldbacteria bacterium]